MSARPRVRWLGFIVAAVVVAGACTRSSPPSVTPPGSASPGSPAPSIPPPAAANPLCDHPAPTPRPAVTGEPLAGPLAEVAAKVEEVRELSFTQSVSPEPVTQRRIGALLQDALDRSFPEEMTDRRARAWSTIGVIPEGTDLRKAIEDFAGSQIIGFYDTETHQLVFTGSESPSPYERLTLAHELTHALDDQHFDLHRLDELESTCQDERLAGFVALAEGDATVTSLRWAQANLSPEEQQQVQQEAGSFPPPPASVPEFLATLLVSPYPSGQAFVEALLARGGQQAVNDAFRNPPASTEQVLHPDRYPEDRPQDVDVPDLAEKLGGPWRPLDEYQVGELWLRILLDLHAPGDEAERAAAGWDGGEYRAWVDGDEVAVLLQTVWDAEEGAVEFAESMERWIGDRTATVERRGTTVDVLFGSDRVALRDLQRAV